MTTLTTAELENWCASRCISPADAAQLRAVFEERDSERANFNLLDEELSETTTQLEIVMGQARESRAKAMNETQIAMEEVAAIERERDEVCAKLAEVTKERDDLKESAQFYFHLGGKSGEELTQLAAKLAAAQLEILALRKVLGSYWSPTDPATGKTIVDKALDSPTVAQPLSDALALAHEALKLGNFDALTDYSFNLNQKAIAALEPWVRNGDTRQQ